MPAVSKRCEKLSKRPMIPDVNVPPLTSCTTMSPLRHVTVSPATTVSFAGLKAVENMSTCASSACAAAGNASAAAAITAALARLT